MLADAPPEVVEQQLQTFLRSLNITDSASTADDPKYHEFVTGEPHQAASYIDWASEYQQAQHDIPSQTRQQHDHVLPEPQAHEAAWSTFRQSQNLRPQTQTHTRPDSGREWADAFRQSQQQPSQSWAEDFAQLHMQGHAQQQSSSHPINSCVSDFQSQRLQPQSADQPWAEQFLAGKAIKALLRLCWPFSWQQLP